MVNYNMIILLVIAIAIYLFTQAPREWRWPARAIMVISAAAIWYWNSLFKLPTPATLAPTPTTLAAASPTATLIDINKFMASTPEPTPVPPPTSNPDQIANPTPVVTVTPATKAEKPVVKAQLKSRVVKHNPEAMGKMDAGELAVVKKALKAISWSRNSDPKAAADEDYAVIVKYSAKGGPHDLWDIVKSCVLGTGASLLK